MSIEKEMPQKTVIVAKPTVEEKAEKPGTIVEPVTPSKVLIVDDKMDDAVVLVRALSVRNIPVLYYTGALSELPSEPIIGARIVFLDMKLKGMETADNPAIFSSLMGILRKVISNKNGPYLIFAWTEHPSLIEGFKTDLQKRGTDITSPITIIDIQKSECMEEGQINYEKVAEKLKVELLKIPLFSFLTKWERIIGESGAETVGSISVLANSSDMLSWKKDLEKILYQIAIAESGDAIDTECETVTRSAMKTLNSILRDCVEKQVYSTKDELLIDPIAGVTDRKRELKTLIPNDIKAKINTKVHLREITNEKNFTSPGKLCIFENYEQLKTLFDHLPVNLSDFQKDFFEKIDGLENLKPCLLDITPVCDYSNGKWKASQMLIGFVLPKTLLNKIKKADFLYKSPSMYLNETECFLLLNFHYIAVLGRQKSEKLTPKYSVRLDMLSDIQDKFSNHISRRGFLRID